MKRRGLWGLALASWIASATGGCGQTSGGGADAGVDEPTPAGTGGAAGAMDAPGAGGSGGAASPDGAPPGEGGAGGRPFDGGSPPEPDAAALFDGPTPPPADALPTDASPAVDAVPGSRARLALRPVQLTFAKTFVREKTTGTITLENVGGSPSGKLTFSVAGVNFADFTLEPRACPEALLPGESCPLTLTFAPQAEGDRSGLLQVSSAAADPAEATLVGAGATKGELSLVSDPNLGDVPRGLDSFIRKVVVENTGTGDVPGVYANLLSDTTFRTPAAACGAVAVGKRCSINVSVHPDNDHALGTAKATLEVGISGAGPPTLKVPLSANVIDGSVLSAAPALIDFGTLPESQATATRPFTITNMGTSPSGTLAAAVAGGIPSNFRVDSIGPIGCSDGLVLPGKTCSVFVVCKQLGAGTFSDTLTVTDNHGHKFTASLKATIVR